MRTSISKLGVSRSYQKSWARQALITWDAPGQAIMRVERRRRERHPGECPSPLEFPDDGLDGGGLRLCGVS